MSVAAGMKAINEHLRSEIHSTLNTANTFLLGKDCILLRGQYKGRRARIENIIVSANLLTGYSLSLLAHPYMLDNKGEIRVPHEFLWDKPDARSYWPLNDVELIDEKHDHSEAKC